MDSESLKVLRKAFTWSDFDGDGLIRYRLDSVSDLKRSSGLKNDEEVQSLFLAIKPGSSTSPYVNFDDFCASVKNFPQLLEQFKEESFTPTMSPAHRCAPIMKPESMALQHLLKSFLYYVYKANSKPNRRPKDLSVNALIDDIEEAVLSMNQDLPISIACGYAISAIKELSSDLDNLKLTYKSELEDAKLTIESLNDYCSQIESTNKILIEEIKQMEINHQKAKEDWNQLLARNSKLERTESDFKEKYQEMIYEVDNKQETIFKLQREIKTIKALKDIPQKQQEEPPKSRRRITELDGTTSGEFQVSLFKQQVDNKNIEINYLKDCITKLHRLYQNTQKKLSACKRENQKLIIRNQRKKFLRKEEVAEMNTEGSLFEEFIRVGKHDSQGNLKISEQSSVQIDKNKLRKCWFFS